MRCVETIVGTCCKANGSGPFRLPVSRNRLLDGDRMSQLNPKLCSGFVKQRQLPDRRRRPKLTGTQAQSQDQ